MSITDGETLRLEGIIAKLQAKSECDDALLIAMSEKCVKLKAELWRLNMKSETKFETVKRKDNTVKVYAAAGYIERLKGNVLCKLENTGNGYIAHFPTHSSCHQDHYVCIDYAQAAVLFKALKQFQKELK